jgi:hypothetical protein
MNRNLLTTKRVLLLGLMFGSLLISSQTWAAQRTVFGDLFGRDG